MNPLASAIFRYIHPCNIIGEANGLLETKMIILINVLQISWQLFPKIADNNNEGRPRPSCEIGPKGRRMAETDLNLRRTFLGGLVPDENQTDIPHMIDFAHRGLPMNFARRDANVPIGDAHRITDIAACDYPDADEVPECRAETHYGAWFESLVSTDTPPPQVQGFIKTGFQANRLFSGEQCVAERGCYIESLMICPKPLSIGTGAHRVAAVFWLSGERYGIAFEEGGGPDRELLERMRNNDSMEYALALITTSIKNSMKENVFIEGLTPGAKKNLSDIGHVTNVIIPSVVYAMTGYHLYPPAHDFVIEVHDGDHPSDGSGPTGHWFEGCRPSDRMYRF